MAITARLDLVDASIGNPILSLVNVRDFISVCDPRVPLAAGACRPPIGIPACASPRL